MAAKTAAEPRVLYGFCWIACFFPNLASEACSIGQEMRGYAPPTTRDKGAGTTPEVEVLGESQQAAGLLTICLFDVFAGLQHVWLPRRYRSGSLGRRGRVPIAVHTL
uniref:Putative secreted protein n=1 Tax=Ixodes ricinus TaxID=34613 RepID=A0A6B0UGQ9_IXORI